MADAPWAPEPRRPTEAARLELARLAPGTPLARVFALACQLAADAIGVERVGLWLFIEDKAALRCACLYERSKGEHSAGAVLRCADFPRYFGALNLRKAVPAELAASDPRTGELVDAYLRPLGISSMLDAGLFVDTDLVGVVCHEHVGSPREWTTEARDFAGSMADLVAMRLQAAELAELRAAFRTQRERLAALEKTDALKQMAAGVAHDFRNLLSVIQGQAELLRDRSDLTTEAARQAGDIVTAAERGTALVGDLLDFARPKDRPPRVLNPADLAAEALPVLQATVGAGHPLRYARPPAVGQVLVEKTAFTRVLLNLVLNARDAMPDGGEIALRVAPVRLSDGQGVSGHYVMLEVSDRGAGMDEATRRRAFEPYFTTKAKGTGLGLAVVRQLVDQAGGLVRIDSTPGKGTVVRVFLPRVGASSGGTVEFVVPPGV